MFLFSLMSIGNLQADTCLYRANAYNYISAFYFLASVGGSSVGSLLLDHHVYFLNGLSITCYMLACSVALAIPAYCGLEIKEHDRDIAITPELDDEDEPGSPLSSSAGLLGRSRSNKPVSIQRSQRNPLEKLILESYLSFE